MGEVKSVSTAGQAFGLGVFLLVLIAVPASCEYRARKVQTESEAVCRRAIERNYSVPAEKAEEQIKAQRAWEGR